MKYLAKATHVKQLILWLKPTAVFKTDATDTWYEADKAAEAAEVEYANACVEEAHKREV